MTITKKSIKTIPDNTCDSEPLRRSLSQQPELPLVQGARGSRLWSSDEKFIRVKQGEDFKDILKRGDVRGRARARIYKIWFYVANAFNS